jgi:hypothetical protein
VGFLFVRSETSPPAFTKNNFAIKGRKPQATREAIEEHQYADADAQIALVAHAIEDEAAYVEHLTPELETAVSTAQSSSAGSPSR